MSMASSTGVFCPSVEGGGPSEVGFVIMGVGVGGDGTDWRCAGMFTGLG